MNECLIQVICGPGRGKTTSAIGRGIVSLGMGKCVSMVQFLKGSMDADKMEVIKRLEPEFKVFRFEKSSTRFDKLSPQEKEEALPASATALILPGRYWSQESAIS